MKHGKAALIGIGLSGVLCLASSAHAADHKMEKGEGGEMGARALDRNG